MRDNDQILLEEAYEQIDERFFGFSRDRAKAGTRMKSLGAKALGGISKMAGDSRLGKVAGELQQAASADIEEKRAAKLTSIFAKKLDKLYMDFQKDAQAIGVDLKKLASYDSQSKQISDKYPKVNGLANFIRYFNMAKEAINKN